MGLDDIEERTYMDSSLNLALDENHNVWSVETPKDPTLLNVVHHIPKIPAFVEQNSDSKTQTSKDLATMKNPSDTDADANDVLSHMLANGIAPDIVTMNTYLKIYGEGLRLNRAE